MNHIKVELVNLSNKLKMFSSKRVNLMTAMLLVGAMSLVGVVASPSKVEAGGPVTGCNKFGGKLALTKGSNRSLKIAANWSKPRGGHGLAPFMNLQPGKKACSYRNFGDVDGFLVSSRCSTDAVIVTQDGKKVIRVLRHYYTGWNKINSFENVMIRNACW